MAKKWLPVDTRLLGKDRGSSFDGFLHLIPYERVKHHQIHIQCWCEPFVIWSTEKDGLIVNHRDLDPKKKKQAVP